MTINFNRPILLAVNEGQQNELPDATETNDNTQEQQRIPIMTDTTESQQITKTHSTTRQAKDFDKPPQEDTSFFGVGSGGLMIGALVINAIFLLVVLFCLIRISELKDRFIKLKENSTDQKNKIEELTEQVAKLERNFDRPNKIFAPPLSAPTAPALQKEPTVTSYGNYTSLNSLEQNAAAAPQSLRSPQDNYKEFVDDFNALLEQSGYESKEARKKFLSKYNVIALSCTNYEERMNEPIPPPKFGRVVPQTSELWAYEFAPDTFAVVPNVKAYTENHHSARAMGVVFRSNFQNGTYNKIHVNKPAIFKGISLEKQGELRLS